MSKIAAKLATLAPLGVVWDLGRHAECASVAFGFLELWAIGSLVLEGQPDRYDESAVKRRTGVAAPLAGGEAFRHQKIRAWVRSLDQLDVAALAGS